MSQCASAAFVPAVTRRRTFLLFLLWLRVHHDCENPQEFALTVQSIGPNSITDRCNKNRVLYYVQWYGVSFVTLSSLK